MSVHFYYRNELVVVVDKIIILQLYEIIPGYNMITSLIIPVYALHIFFIDVFITVNIERCNIDTIISYIVVLLEKFVIN